MPLLERETQLASLGKYAAEARQGEGRLVLIAGEAGVGKSALVEQVQRVLPRATWCWGACDGLFIPRPLGPLFDIASTLGGELLELCRADAQREALFSALLRQVSAPGGLHVLVVEDVHWADEATIDLLRFLGRRIRDAAVLVLATYRDEGVTVMDPLRVALGDLATQRSVRRINLPPLSADAVAVLADGSGLDPAALYRLTGGNPFFVSQAVQAGMRGAICEVPASARDAVLARAARLGSDSRAVLDAAALIGTHVELALLESVADCPPSVLEELLASGLLTTDGMTVQFRHEIARLAVEGAVLAHWRIAINARILASLHALGCDDDARMAFHAEAAGMARRRCAMRPRPPAGPPRWPRTVRRRPSSNGRCASRMEPIPPWLPACTTASPMRHRCWTTGRRRPTLVSRRSPCGTRWVICCARATLSAGVPTRYAR